MKPPAWSRPSALACRSLSQAIESSFFTTSPAASATTAGTRPSPSAPTYKKVGCTAGFEPSGGGFAEYVRVMDWIVEQGTVKIPHGVSFEQACFVEPVNTCMKGIEALRLQPGETVLAIGQGPIGIILSVLARKAGATVITSDLYPERLRIAKSLGFEHTIDASKNDAVRLCTGADRRPGCGRCDLGGGQQCA